MEKSNAILERVKSATLTKQSQRDIADQLISQVINGDVDPIQTYAQIKGVVECLSLVLKDQTIIDTTIAACAKYGKDVPTFGGAKISVVEAGVKYDFSVCEDIEWNELSSQKKELEQKIKMRETFLKGINVTQTLVDEGTGAIITVYPPAKTSSTVVKVNFQK